MTEVKKPRTRVAIVLDKSGSMATTKEDAIQGLNEQIQQAKMRVDTHDLLCSLVTFDGDVYEHLWDVPADKLVEAKAEDFIPSGSTAWRDAVGYTIQKLLATETPDDADTAYLVYVISDGQTNADQHFGPDALKELIEGCKATKRWTITFMGHDARYLENIARQTGVPVANCAAWSNKTRGAVQRSNTHQKARLSKFYDERAAGQTAASNFASNKVGVTADYMSESLESNEAAPVIETPVLGVPANLQDILAKMPKASCQASAYDGAGVFTNTARVSWEDSPQVEATPPANLAGGVYLNNRPAVWKNKR